MLKLSNPHLYDDKCSNPRIWYGFSICSSLQLDCSSPCFKLSSKRSCMLLDKYIPRSVIIFFFTIKNRILPLCVILGFLYIKGACRFCLLMFWEVFLNYVYHLWQIYFDIWQNQYNTVKLNKIKLKNKIKVDSLVLSMYSITSQKNINNFAFYFTILYLFLFSNWTKISRTKLILNFLPEWKILLVFHLLAWYQLLEAFR